MHVRDRIGKLSSRLSGTGRDMILRGLLSHSSVLSALLWQQARGPSPGSSDCLPPKVSVRLEPLLPRLAWVCTRSADEFGFVAGSGVELFDSGLFEGVWDAEFDDPLQLSSALHFGSGALFYENAVLFMPPKHLYEHLYLVRDKVRGVDVISPSLCCCLATACVSEAFLSRVNQTISKSTHWATKLGAYLSRPHVCEDYRFILYRMMYHNFTVSSGGEIRLKPQDYARSFPSFSEYREYLGDTLGRIFANATHERRSARLPPISTVSRGYDAPAVSALAAAQGCRDAVTHRVAVYGTHLDDCGTQIGKALGLRVFEHEHVLGPHISNLEISLPKNLFDQAAEFIATAGIGDDIAFLGFEPNLAGRTLLTGAWGDSIWDRHSTVYAGLPVRIRFGKSLTEFRLRVGFAHVPVPTCGGILPRSIVAISSSDEMKSFSIGGKYDRPIPRRIAEEAGVSRKEFGNLKAATAPDFLNAKGLWLPSAEKIMRRYSMCAL